MTVAPSPIIVNALAPVFLAPTWRFANDDWKGSNALVYRVYAMAPVASADGTFSGGTLMDLTGYAAGGVLCYPPVLPPRLGAPAFGDNRAPLPALTAAIDFPNSDIVLSLGAADTGFFAQDEAEFTTGRALLQVRPAMVDPSGNLVTIGIQPLFVF